MTPVAGAEPAAGCCCGDGLALTGRGTPTQLRVGGSGGPGAGWRLQTQHRHITPHTLPTLNVIMGWWAGQ